MPRYYCDYCDTYLTHDSPSVRKQHNSGYKHKANVRSYYQQYEAQLNQSLIDQRVKEHLVAFRAPAAPYAQMRPGLPVFPTPAQIPMAGNPQLPAGTPLIPGVRPPVLPRPLPGTPGYLSGPPMPPMVAPPGAPMPGQVNNFPRLPVSAPASLPGSAGMTTPTGAPPMYAPPPMHQGGIPVPTSAAGDSSSNSQVPPESNQ